jgi:hypothetical protein
VVPKEAVTTLAVKPDCTASKAADEGRGATDRGQRGKAARKPRQHLIAASVLHFVHCGNDSRRAKLRFMLQDIPGKGMSEVAERYRSYAAECLRIAQDVSRPKEKLALLNMAQCWLALAEQAIKDSEIEPLTRRTT